MSNDLSNQNKIKANFVFPPDRGVFNIDGNEIFVYGLVKKSTNEKEARSVSKEDFIKLANGNSIWPPLVKSCVRGGNTNVGFMCMWVTPDGTMHWKIGELLTGKTFEEINWKPYHQIPGRKNKGIGITNDVYEQGIFESSGRWIDFLEQKSYKLLFQSDEVVGNRLYMMRSNSPSILNGNITVPKCMLAEKFDIDFIPDGPFVYEPKYDGCRHVTTMNNGEISFFTRKRKPVEFLNHIKPQALLVFEVMQELLGKTDKTCEYWLDGEMYRHGWTFQKTMSAVRRSVNQSALSNEIVYMVYDLIDDGKIIFAHRREFLKRVFSDPRVANLPNIKLTQYWVCTDVNFVWQLPEIMENAGYEGVMIRTLESTYLSHSSTRSKGLLKVKRFMDEEGWIMDVVSATGTQEGCATYVCNSKKDGSGYTYNADPAGVGIGDLDSRRSQYQNKNLFIGTMVTVKYFEKTDAGIPRFPKIIGFERDDLPDDDGKEEDSD